MAIHRAVSLFSNCGAGDVGYKRAGFSFDVVSDIDPRRLEIAQLNHSDAIGVVGDLRITWREVVNSYREKAGDEKLSLLAACPPCQGMSSINSDRGRSEDADAGSKDERNLLVVVIANVARELNPSIIIVENVPAFLTRKVRHPVNKTPVSAASLLIAALSDNYIVFPILADLSDFGVPQSRKRTFLTFVRRGIKGLDRFLAQHRAPYPRPTHAQEYGGKEPIKLREALDNFALPPLDAGQQETAVSEIGNGLHCVPVWDDRRYPMVAAIPSGSGSSAWNTNKCHECHEENISEACAVCPKCDTLLLRPVIEEKDGTYRLVNGFRSSSYRRMSPDLPASTITTASGHIGSSRTIHPFENRLLSPLECAYLQTFPEDFAWGEALDKWGHTNVRAMIGEAVPPHFTHLHGNALIGLLNDNWTLAPISLSDSRCTKAYRKLGMLVPSNKKQSTLF